MPGASADLGRYEDLPESALRPTNPIAPVSVSSKWWTSQRSSPDRVRETESTGEALCCARGIPGGRLFGTGDVGNAEEERGRARSGEHDCDADRHGRGRARPRRRIPARDLQDAAP